MIDVGGGSTELVLGRAGEVSWHTSLQVGVVRHSERHLHSDPPTAAELDALRARTCALDVPAADGRRRDRRRRHPDPERRDRPWAGPATTRSGSRATSSRPRPWPNSWTGWPRSRSPSGANVRGLDPARAPVIVAGIAILLEVVRCFGLPSVEASERDILWGLALSTTIANLKSRSRLSARGHLFDCPCLDPRWRIPPSEGRSCLPPPSHRHIGPGDAASSAPPAAWTTQ